MRALRTSSARPPWLRLIRFNSRRSEGLDLKGAGMKASIPQTPVMSLLHCTRSNQQKKFTGKNKLPGSGSCLLAMRQVMQSLL